MTKSSSRRKTAPSDAAGDYDGLLGSVGELLEAARRASARTVNALMTATYWEVGRRIVEFEQGGKKRAEYGEGLLKRLSVDLSVRCGRGFSVQNLENMRLLYDACDVDQISQTLSGKLATGIEGPALEVNISQTVSGISSSEQGGGSSLPSHLVVVSRAFPLPWSHYVLLVRRARSREAFSFYHTEALRGGWSVRQLQRQIDSQFYERIALSRNKAAMLAKAAKPQAGDVVSADEEIRQPAKQAARSRIPDGLARRENLGC